MATDTDLIERIESSDLIGSSDDARAAIEATMETLGERITDGQAADLAEPLPDAAADPLRDATPGEAEDFSLAVFVERVDERTSGTGDVAEGDDPIEPVERTRAVLTAVSEVAVDTEIERTREQLPAAFDLVFDPGRPMDEAEFLEIVADELPDAVDVDPETATAATLETLADRITGGQAGNLAMYLPRSVRAPLTETDEDALTFDRDEFRERLATRANVEKSEATDVSRAVFTAVASTTAHRELGNVRTQLPTRYEQLFNADAEDG